MKVIKHPKPSNSSGWGPVYDCDLGSYYLLGLRETENITKIGIFSAQAQLQVDSLMLRIL